MGEVVNLRRARKQKARAKAATTAGENRTKYGRTKAERARQSADSASLSKVLDRAKIDTQE